MKLHVGLLERYGGTPEEIEARGLAAARALLPPMGLSPEQETVALAVVRATADPTLAGLLRFHPRAVEEAVAALQRRAIIVVDSNVTAAGLDSRLLTRLGCPPLVAISLPDAAQEAAHRRITRSAAGMLLARDALQGALAVVGTAPTALLALLDMVDSGEARPAAVVGVPVGLVAAPEAKEELQRRPLPWIALEGPRGGAAVAAAIVNAIMGIACRRSEAREEAKGGDEQ